MFIRGGECSFIIGEIQFDFIRRCDMVFLITYRDGSTSSPLLKVTFLKSHKVLIRILSF